ncbi:MAG: YbaY family lipoprotein [Chloroflexota bacterium]|nr:YbaY family lipoprotein [Chloroflexota bacterium]
MMNKLKNALLPVISISIVLLALAACGGDSTPANATVEVPSGKSPNASVSGTVTYRERIALSPGAQLVVSLRDVSLQDAAAPLIARQTIDNPGQVPIKFKVEYNRDDIDSRNTYGISARIIESDGRLAFTNDTAYDVITRGNPSKVDMLLVIVQPPPDQVEEGVDWRQWVDTPARVIWANLIPNEPELYLRIGYYQSTIENCARPGSQGLEVDGDTIRATITLMQPPPTSWAIPCDEKLVELDAVEPIGDALEPGETYRVIVNDVATTSFTLPRANFGHSIIAESPVESAEIMVLESAPPQYQLRVVSGLPKGSGCSQFNGYEIRRTTSNEIEVAITHHEVADQMVICTADFPIVETVVPLGSDFESGEKYTVRVNSDKVTSFVAQ